MGYLKALAAQYAEFCDVKRKTHVKMPNVAFRQLTKSQVQRKMKVSIP